MRKYSILTIVLISFYLQSVSQKTYLTIAVEKKVDSLRRILPSLKGSEKVDCLNSLSEGLFWIWEDDTTQLHDGCTYAHQAFDEAKKIGYKRGLGHAYSNMAACETGRTNIINTASIRKDPTKYRIPEQSAKEAIKIGDQLNDNFLIASAYETLAWIESGKGNAEQNIMNLKACISYYEKAKPQTKGTYQGFRYTDCIDCSQSDFRLANLYQKLVRLQNDLSSSTIQLIEKAITSSQKSNAKSRLAGAYGMKATFLMQTSNLEEGIEYFEKAIAAYHEDGSEGWGLDALIELCSLYWNLGDFEKGLETSKKIITIAESRIKEEYAGSADTLRLGQAYYWMGRFYQIAGDYETAFIFMHKARPFYSDRFPGWLSQWIVAMGEIHRLNRNYDSAMHYLARFETQQGGKPMLSNLYVSLKQYDRALKIMNDVLGLEANRNNLMGLGRNYIIISKAYLGKSDYNSALMNARLGLSILGKIKRNTYVIDGYQTISEIFSNLGKNDSAYYYLKQYTILKDSLFNRQLYIRLNDYKKEAEEAKRIGQIKLLQKDYLIKEQELQQQVLLKEQSEAQLSLSSKDNELKDQKIKEQTLLKEQQQAQLTLYDKENKLKDQRLKQQAFIRNALLGGLLLFTLLGVFIYRNFSLKRKNEKLAIKKDQAELQQRVAELEMQALRAQMNPHFIFNCLSSINRFIFKNDNKLASDYLTRFSRLIRMVLMHSQKKLIPLEDELEMLRLYLDLERLRFKDAFDYSITTTNIVDAGAIFIPPLLLQPFCENAVWHGLMHKESKGHLNVIISEVINENEKNLHCVIEDDGVGREKAAEMKSKSAESEKSLGLKITTERLALLNQENNFNTFYKIEDILNENNEVAGTSVQLKIRHKESIEEYA